MKNITFFFSTCLLTFSVFILSALCSRLLENCILIFLSSNVIFFHTSDSTNHSLEFLRLTNIFLYFLRTILLSDTIHRTSCINVEAEKQREMGKMEKQVDDFCAAFFSNRLRTRVLNPDLVSTYWASVEKIYGSFFKRIA